MAATNNPHARPTKARTGPWMPYTLKYQGKGGKGLVPCTRCFRVRTAGEPGWFWRRLNGCGSLAVQPIVYRACPGCRAAIDQKEHDGRA